MKLSSKIFLGFSVILLIALILTGFSVYIMKKVAIEANTLSSQYMPQTDIAKDLEVHALKTISAMLAYNFSHDDKFMAEAKQNFLGVRKNLQEAEKLTAQYPSLRILLDNTKKAAERLSEYESIVAATEKLVIDIRNIRKKLAVSANDFQKPCDDYLNGQTAKLTKDINAASAPERLQDRITKIATMNEIMDLGSAIQLETALAQLHRQPQLLVGAMAKFQEMENDLNSLQKKSIDPANIGLLEDIRMAASDYKSSMKKLVAIFATLGI